MRVGDSSAAKSLGKSVAIELRILARARDGTNVDETLDAVGSEEGEKGFDGTIGMADVENGRCEMIRFGRMNRGCGLTAGLESGSFFACRIFRHGCDSEAGVSFSEAIQT